ncbi:MAG: hypothetical protein AB3N10_11165 [Allomuricauda sp.]
MYFHGSPVGGVEFLKPNETTFRKGDDAHVYLTSNKAHATLYAAKCHMYPYGFDKETGLPKFPEPFEDCLKEFYEGKSGYLYSVEESDEISPLEGIKYAFHTKKSVRVKSEEYIEDVYRKLLEYEKNGEIILIKFKDKPERMRERTHKQITQILEDEEIFSSTEEYPMFLKKKFPDAWKEVCDKRKNMT